MDRCPRIVGRGPNLPTPSGVSLPTCSTPRPWWPPRRDFEAVFRDAFEPMVRALTVASGSRTVAEDCVQEAFSRAFVRWRRIGGYDDPAGWIRHVAVNVMRDHHRREQRKGRAAHPHGGPARRGRRRRRTRPVPGSRELVAALPEQQRIAASLFYVEQLSVRETAARDGPVRGRRQVPPPRREDLAAPCLGAELVTDHDPLDELDDPTLAAALASLAPPSTDGDPYPAAHRHFVRRRRRHRIVTASGAVVGRGRRRARRRRAHRRRLDRERRPHGGPGRVELAVARHRAVVVVAPRAPGPVDEQHHHRRRHRRPRDRRGPRRPPPPAASTPTAAGDPARRDRRQRGRLGPGPDRGDDRDPAREHTGRGLHRRRAGVGTGRGGGPVPHGVERRHRAPDPAAVRFRRGAAAAR